LLLTCRLPFEGDDVATKLMAKFTTDPPLLDTLRDDVPRELARLVAKMMHRDRDKRLGTPFEVAEAFSRFAVVGGAPEKRPAETSAVNAEFLHSVESIHEVPLIRRPPRTNSPQKLIAWLRRIFASGAVRPARG
jgi:hypothetical protein